MPRPVDLETWSRKQAYDFFRDYEDPFFNVTVQVDATNLFELCSDNSLSFAAACVYYSQKTANTIREFRIRLVEGQLVEFESVDATQTILQDDESFTFCYLEPASDLGTFCANARENVEKYKLLRTFDVESDRVDLIYYSVLPWLSFTSFKHASRHNPDQTIPRIAFGKFKKAGGQLMMPLSVEVNHRIMDGIHVGRFVEGFEKAVRECSLESRNVAN